MSTTPADRTVPSPPPVVPAPSRNRGARERRRWRRLGARIGEAVRAAHSASVPF